MKTATSTLTPAQKGFRRFRAALTGACCPVCPGTLVLKEMDHTTDAGLHVPDALINVCDQCGNQVVADAEGHRWHAEK